MKIIIERLRANNVKTVLDAGCGTCGPMIRLLEEGFKVQGFDFAEEMVKEGKRELKKNGFDNEIISLNDLEDERNLPKDKFDSVIALGVFPHILDEIKALLNIRKLLNPNGLVFIEFRNDLFSTYSMNKYSLDFFLNSVINIESFTQDLQDEINNFYSERLKIEMPLKKHNERIVHDDMLSKFQNPLSIENELFETCNFKVLNYNFYHSHSFLPFFESKNPELFRELSLKLENPNSWKGYLMASAFVVEARSNH